MRSGVRRPEVLVETLDRLVPGIGTIHGFCRSRTRPVPPGRRWRPCAQQPPPGTTSARLRLRCLSLEDAEARMSPSPKWVSSSNLSGQQAAPEWAEGHEAVELRHAAVFVLGLSPEQRVLALQRGDGLHGHDRRIVATPASDIPKSQNISGRDRPRRFPATSSMGTSGSTPVLVGPGRWRRPHGPEGALKQAARYHAACWTRGSRVRAHVLVEREPELGGDHDVLADPPPLSHPLLL